MNPPRAIVRDDELAFAYDRTDNNLSATRPEFERDLASVREWAAWVNIQVDEYNDALESVIRPLVEARRQRLSSGKQHLADLGFKVRSKDAAMASPTGIPNSGTSSSSPSGRGSSKKSRSAKQYDVALSFAGEERTYVETVATILKAKGIKVFYDGFEEISLWGTNLVDHLSEVYTNRATFIVMFLSEHYATKAWPTFERQQAQARALVAKETVILPVRFDDTNVPGLSTVKFLDLRTLTPQQLAERIEEKLKHA